MLRDPSVVDANVCASSMVSMVDICEQHRSPIGVGCAILRRDCEGRLMERRLDRLSVADYLEQESRSTIRHESWMVKRLRWLRGRSATNSLSAI